MRRHRAIQAAVLAAVLIAVAAVAWPTTEHANRPESTYSQRHALPTTAIAIGGLLALLAYSRAQTRRS